MLARVHYSSQVFDIASLLLFNEKSSVLTNYLLTRILDNNGNSIVTAVTLQLFENLDDTV